ncbi:MAG: YggS family pyridoxal phosphate-dependent enzyme [Flavobacteriaceae bacterium]
MSIAQHLSEIKAELPSKVVLVAVSKTKPIEDLEQAYAAGQRVFGENKVQEMCEKHEGLPKDIQWHMIGHVQRNKIKYMAPFVSLIHGVDSIKTLKEVHKQGLKNKRIIPVLLQVKIAKEDTKFGIEPSELSDFLEEVVNLELKNVEIQGFMGMASNQTKQEVVREEFSILKTLFNKYQNQFSNFHTLSMGMSGDYKIAIEEGSTMVRVGSAIFGTRNYAI